MTACESYPVALVGLRKMSRGHLRAVASAPRLELAAVCDTREEVLEAAELDPAVRRFTDLHEMMRTVAPVIVLVATPNTSHAAVTLALAAYRPGAILCEKPLSVHYGDAVAMVEACEKASVILLVNHQRRLLAAAAGRRWITGGAIGELLEIEARCPGDLLSDGTHAVDAALCLGGDARVESVFGAVDCGPETTERYGHPVERSAHACWYDTGGVRYTVTTGELTRRTEYQSWRVRGTGGELWHPGGRHQPHWWINDGGPGDHALKLDGSRWFTSPVPSPDGGPWRLLPAAPPVRELLLSLELLVGQLDGTRGSHPLDARTALPCQEIINACYLSALERRSVRLPLPRDARYPAEALFGQEPD